MKCNINHKDLYEQTSTSSGQTALRNSLTLQTEKNRLDIEKDTQMYMDSYQEKVITDNV